GIVYRKKWKGILSVLLVCVLLSGMFTNKISVAAADTDMTSTGTTKELTVTESVTVGERTLEFCVKVFYTLPNEYEVLMDAYGEALYSEDFNTCIEGNAVHNDKDEENIPEGAYYYCANDGINKEDGSLNYGGSVTFEGGNGYVLMKEAYGKMVYVKPGIEGIKDMKYLVVESKLQYNTAGIEFKFMTRGANSSNKAKIETLGVLKDGVLSKEDGTKIADITAGSWHTFTYVFDIAKNKYDLYIDGEIKQDDATCNYFRGFNGDDHFRLKAASLTEGTTGADIMIDDIKVYGGVSDPTSSLTEEVTYDSLITAYGTVLYGEDFNNCTNGDAVHNDKDEENIPKGAYYYCANEGEYGGTITYVRGNGYVLMKEAYGQMVYVKPGIEGIADMKYLVVESKLQYNTPGIEFKFMTRGANSSSAKIETLGVLKDGKFFSKEDGTKIADITAGSWHTFTYVFDIAKRKYDLYIDGEIKQDDATCNYFRGFNGDDHFRLKAASLTAGTTGADIMIDDIRVYGSVSDPTVIQTTTE
ncbi:MAG: hypothetical protein J6D02_06355, partial [Lachnospira sp.]|nr:hypothetical protein [Lachnospira sp.]